MDLGEILVGVYLANFCVNYIVALAPYCLS